jgi:hypothetical protein
MAWSKVGLSGASTVHTVLLLQRGWSEGRRGCGLDRMGRRAEREVIGGRGEMMVGWRGDFGA